MSGSSVRARRWRLCVSLLVSIAAGSASLAQPGDCAVGAASVHGYRVTPRGGGFDAVMTPDARFVAFSSSATTLGPTATNSHTNIYVLDRQTGQFDLASVSSSDEQANSDCYTPSLSADGRFVAFESTASNLVEGDTNGVADVFVVDRVTRQVKRASISTANGQGDRDSFGARLSASGRHIAFASAATTLVPGDANNVEDIFVRDLVSGVTVRASVSGAGEQGDGDSYAPSLSADGRLVVFLSYARNLVAGGGYYAQVYVRDLDAQTTGRVSLNTAGTPGNSSSYSPTLSANGRYVVFTSYSTNLVQDGQSSYGTQAYLRDRVTATTSRVSVNSDGIVANNYSYAGSVSNDGQAVTFYSAATNLDQRANSYVDQAYVLDRGLGFTTLLSLGPNGSAGNGDSGETVYHPYSQVPALGISADARYVVFDSRAWNLVDGDGNQATDVFLRDRQSGTTALLTAIAPIGTGDSASSTPALSADGRFVAFQSLASDLLPGNIDLYPSGKSEIFVRDRQQEVPTRVSISNSLYQGYSYGNPNGDSYNPSISADGTVVAFDSLATNLMPGNTPAARDTNDTYDVYVRDLTQSLTTRVSLSSAGLQGDGPSRFPALSGDGRVVAFESAATNLVPGDTNHRYDVFTVDMDTGATTRVSRASSGAQGNDDSFAAKASGDGRYVVFASYASNLVTGDTNGACDIFRRDRQTSSTLRVSVGTGGVQANGSSFAPAISDDGKIVVFESDATNLVTGDTNGVTDIFVHEIDSGETVRSSVRSDGTQGNDASFLGAVSRDGRYVAFESYASNLSEDDDTNPGLDVFVHDRYLGRTFRESLTASGDSGEAALSGNGRVVAFSSSASGLVADDRNHTSDVFVRTRACEVCAADFNNDGFVDPIDYNEFINAFEAGDMSADVNQDGFLDPLDYNGYINAFEAGC